MLAKTKTFVKIWKLKIWKKKKNSLEIWWRASYPQNLAWIYAAVCEKIEFTDDQRTDGRTTDACAMTVALLTKSSKAKNCLEIWWIASYMYLSTKFGTGQFVGWFIDLTGLIWVRYDKRESSPSSVPVTPGHDHTLTPRVGCDIALWRPHMPYAFSKYWHVRQQI